MGSTTLSTVKCVKCLKVEKLYGSSIKQAMYCKDCFLNMVQQKFSYSLGKHRVFKDAIASNTLLLHIGDPASSLLFSLVSNRLALCYAKRLRINPSILFLFDVDDLKVIELQVVKCKKLLKQFESQGWKLYFAHVAAIFNSVFYFNNHYDTIFEEVQGLNNITQYNLLLKSIKENSVRRELNRLFRNLLINRIAREVDCSKVMLPDNAEALAKISFNALCFGRGAAICDLTAVVKKSFDNVQFIRPLKDISDKEVFLYYQLNDFFVDSAFEENLQNHSSDIESGGIQHQTANFIFSLQSGGFPATVATILSIAGKLTQTDEKLLNLNDNIKENDYNKCNIKNYAQIISNKKDDGKRQRLLSCQACFTGFIGGNEVEKSQINADESVLKFCKPCAKLLNELKLNERSRTGSEETYEKILHLFKSGVKSI